MVNNTREHILRLVEEEDVEFIRLQFTDMFGVLKNIAVTSRNLEKALDNRCMIEGGSIEGFDRNGADDLCLHPDLSTFCILPWRPQQGKVARILCDVYRADGSIYEESSRYIFRKVLAQAQDMGYAFQVGPECEFFLFHTDEAGGPTTLSHEKAGYLDIGPVDLGENARRDMVLTLEDMGFFIESSHHEVAPAQHEIDFRFAEGLQTADDVMTFKMAVRTIARRHGLHATFMPKPKSGENGSGMHMHMSLSREGRNIFADEKDENGLSLEAYSFIGGLLEHIRAMTLVTNPLVNSYKRLQPGYEAPTAVSWSAKNGTHLIRIPAVRGSAARVELRSPDASANPYLTLALCLAAGLDGIRRKLLPPAPISAKYEELSEKDKECLTKLPRTLGEAIEAFEGDDFVREVLGENFCRTYVQLKKDEWARYLSRVSQWELEEYLYCI